MKDLKTALPNYSVFLINGSVAEILNRSSKVNYDPALKVTGMIFDKVANQIMASIFKEYLDIAHVYKLPIIIHAPTIYSHKITKIKHVEEKCVEFMQQLVADSNANAFITATMAV